MSTNDKTGVAAVRGVGPATETRLNTAGIKLASDLAQAPLAQIVALGIPKGTAQSLINAAKELTGTVNSVAKEVQTVTADIVAGEYSQEDIEGAKMCNMSIDEYLALTPSQRARRLKIAQMQVDGEPIDDRDFIQDLNLGDVTARELIRQQQKKQAEERRLLKQQTSTATAELVKREITQGAVPDKASEDVLGQRFSAEPDVDEETDPIYIRRPKRKSRNTRGTDKIVQQILDDLL